MDSTLSLFDAPASAMRARPSSRPPRHVVNDTQVSLERMRTGVCLASMAYVGGWNFNCFGNGYLTLYQADRGTPSQLVYRIDGELAARLRAIGSATEADDTARTRQVLELFGHPAARGQ